MSATVTSTATEQLAVQVGAYTLTGNIERLRDAALEVLGRDWSLRSYLSGRVVIEHRSGRVQVAVDDGEFSVEEVDRYSFEVGTTIFRGDQRVQTLRALRFAAQLAAEVGA